MSQKRSKSLRILPLSLILLLMLGQYGCDGSSQVVDPPPERNTYAITGALVENLNLDTNDTDTSKVAIHLERNDSVLSTAVIDFAGDTLVFGQLITALDSVYRFGFTSTPLWTTGAYEIMIEDVGIFGDTILVNVPDTFRIDFYTGDSTIPNAGGEEIQVSWTGSQNSEGYVLAVVKEDLAYTGAGYSAYVTTQGTEATIPPDAFRLPNDDLDVGTYLIFVYSFAGSPDSAFASEFLPVPLPSQLTNNIDHTNLTGRFGSVVVTERVTKVVAQSP